MRLYHVTSEKLAKKYRESGCIHKPVRGFTTLQGAMAWAIKVGRPIIYVVEGETAYKLPDHHNKWGEAWWIDNDIDLENVKCAFSAVKDA